MSSLKYGWIAVAAIVVGIAFLTFVGQPNRLPAEEQQVRKEAALRVNAIHAEERAAQELEASEAPAPAPVEEPAQDAQPEDEKENDMWPEEAPDVFKVKFECTHGDFVVEVNKEWAPRGAERFYQLVKEGFYDDSAFFRVVPGFVVQFGLAGDPTVTAKWRNQRIQDDPVTQSNLPGYLTFATSGPNTRTTQLFINTGANSNLDNMGFAPFGKVVEGMEVVKEINSEYRERPNQGLITAEGNSYLRKNFPNITFIKKAELIK